MPAAPSPFLRNALAVPTDDLAALIDLITILDLESEVSWTAEEERAFRSLVSRLNRAREER